MAKPDLQKRAERLLDRKLKAEGDLVATLSQIAATHQIASTVQPAAPLLAEESVAPTGLPYVHVPVGASAVLSVTTHGVALGLSFNRNPVAHPATTKFTVPLSLIQGDNYLVMVLLGKGTWAYDIQLYAHGVLVDRAYAQDDGHGSTPPSPIVWHIAMP